MLIMQAKTDIARLLVSVKPSNSVDQICSLNTVKACVRACLTRKEERSGWKCLFCSYKKPVISLPEKMKSLFKKVLGQKKRNVGAS